MNSSMQFKTYLEHLSGRINEPASIKALLAPFGLEFGGSEDKTLLLGHVLDWAAQTYQPQDEVDCFDVISAADDLGMAAADEAFQQLALAVILNLHKH